MGLLLREDKEMGGKWEGGRGEGGEKIRGEERGETPKVDSHSMSEILKNTLIAELIWLVGAATPTFAPGGKHPRAATVHEYFPSSRQ